MANASKLKSLKKTLGQAPSEAEASNNIYEPEAIVGGKLPEPLYQARLDGRSLRRSGRTIRFATTVTPTFDMQVRQIAQEEHILIVEVLERALQQYVKTRSKFSKKS
jgi:hypothetical protein